MTEINNKHLDSLVNELEERAKELNCLYTIEETLNNPSGDIEGAVQKTVDALPNGFQFPEHCQARINIRGKLYKTENFIETAWSICEPIWLREKKIGGITMSYMKRVADNDEDIFLKEEGKLLKTVSDRLSHFILHNDLKVIFKDFQDVKGHVKHGGHGEYRVVLDMIRKTDPTLFMRILSKLLHQLCYKGIEEADILLQQSSIATKGEDFDSSDENKPLKKKVINNYDEYIEAILNLANEHLPHDEMLMKIQKWIKEDKSSELVKIVEARESSLAAISDAIRKYYHVAPEKFDLSPPMINGLRVSLLRRFFTEDLDYIRIAKEFVKLTDFYNLIDKMIYTPTSQGKLGGKSSGVFLAQHILQNKSDAHPLLKNIKSPKSWFVASDCVLAFMRYNNLEEVLEQKYKEVDELRLEYPQLVQLFKNSQFPPDIEKGLSMALDDLGDRPIVVRSSSLLEDQMGSSFSGKYKSLFLANQGTKQEKLAALEDAIAEVYASTFAPDPIEYRAERGLLDFHEEMGVMIQEVVGNKIGKYFLPTYAGVAFSNNEFRWSPRIKRNDGLIRLVPGLGTRAVDRLGDDYPILIAPGQPHLRVNVTVEELIRYAPKRIDVINLENNEFETIEIDDLIRIYGDQFPGINHVVSMVDDGMIRQPMGLNVDYQNKDFVVTFNGLIQNTSFVKKAGLILKTLEESLKTPVDIEFASDGRDFYLLQCRPQSYLSEQTADPIPKDIPKDRKIFSANKHISNGKVPDITHIVYVDPVKYGELESRERMLRVGRAVGKLNKLLPKRKFILMGPGRWGSRGDIKLGVSITYSDIKNTAMLIEIAKQKGKYVPDLSFGTHFFQDLVESAIRYLPLYPDEKGNIFNKRFFEVSKNCFAKMLPDYHQLEDVIKVIDVPDNTNGMILKVLVNAELDEALAVLRSPDGEQIQTNTIASHVSEGHPTDDWKWRYEMAKKIAAHIDPIKFGVKRIYIFGSAKNAVAGPASDIDLLVHVTGNEEQLKLLDNWFEGWSLSLSEINYLRTGYKTSGLLDIHYITDEDIEKRTSFAVKIGAVTDAAKELKMGHSSK